MQTTIEKEIITKKEACDILQIKNHTLNNLIKNGIILSADKGIIFSSIFEYKKELDERRSIDKPIWVNRGGYGSV
jgi:plasmid maintenance system antidote protein VapI